MAKDRLIPVYDAAGPHKKMKGMLWMHGSEARYGGDCFDGQPFGGFKTVAEAMDAYERWYWFSSKNLSSTLPAKRLIH